MRRHLTALAMAIGSATVLFCAGCDVHVHEKTPDVHVTAPAKAPDINVVTPKAPDVNIDVKK